MPQVVIENPILNSPYKEPAKHFKFSDDGITDEIVESRRISTYFVPIAKPRKKAGGKQLALDTGWTQDRVEENEFINRIRARVSIWRKGNYAGITNTTRQLLEYWTNPCRSMGSHSTDDLLAELKGVFLLILDDWGVEYGSDWEQAKFDELLTSRFASALPTVLTTNKDILELPDRIRSRFGDRRLSRIAYDSAPDYRKHAQ